MSARRDTSRDTLRLALVFCRARSLARLASPAGRAAPGPVGAGADIAAWSFHPRKIVTTGEGGAVTTNDAAVAEAVASGRNHGWPEGSFTPDGDFLPGRREFSDTFLTRGGLPARPVVVNPYPA